MGALQMAETEPSGNTISKGQEKLRKPSTDSSQSPKGTQPSCLRGAFIRIFLKRAEPNDRTEEDVASNQNTEDQEGVRSKKRRVNGSIFRLPCLRPAETTGNDIQDKTEEQSNDLVQEEELKPYSKASFLRKIRCYRLMREKDATEKEKVIEMAQRKHDREDAEVKQVKERVLEQSEEGLQSIKQDEVVGEEGIDTEQDCNAKGLVEAGGDVQEKGKDTTEQDCHTIGLVEAGGDVQEKEKDTTEEDCHAKGLLEVDGDVQEGDVNVERVGGQENSLRKQECCAENLSGKGEESGKIEDTAQGLGEMGKDTTEQESCVAALKENSVLVEGEVSLLNDKKLEEKCEVRKAEIGENVFEGIREQVEDMLEHKNHAAEVDDLDNALSEEVRQPIEVESQEKHISNQDEEKMVKILVSEDNHNIVTTDAEESVGAMQHIISENKCNPGELGDAVNFLPDQEGHTEKVGNTESNLLEQQHLEEDMKEDTRNLSEQDGQVGKKGLEEEDVNEQDSQGDSSDKTENNQEKESHIGMSGDQKNNLIQESQVENTTKEISKLGSQHIVKDTQGKTLEEFEDNTEDLSGISSGVQDDQNFTNNMSNQEVTTTMLNQESVISETSQLQDSSSKRTLSSGDNRELPASVRKKTTSNNIITCDFSEEEHTKVLELQKEVLTSTKKTVDLTYQEPNTLDTSVSSEDDDMGCDSRDLGSLREEVKDMVEWLVQEASDRLSIYAQESESTG